MCNHYRKGQPVIGFSGVHLAGLKIAEALGEVAEHTYPKYPAPIVMQNAGERSLVTKSWGIPISVKSEGGKSITRPVTIARYGFHFPPVAGCGGSGGAASRLASDS